MNRHPLPVAAALAAAGLLLACLPAAADTPALLSDRQLSENYGQGLTAPVLAALASAEDAGRVALPDAARSDDALATAALSAAATATLERQLAEQQQAGTVGLRQGIDLAGTVVNIARFQAVSAVTLPVLGLPFLFVPAMGMLPSMPAPQQQNNNGNGGSSTGPGGH